MAAPPKLLSVCVCALLIALMPVVGFVAENAQPATGGIASDPFLVCMRELAVDPKYSDIAERLPLADMTTISFKMLADQTIPTPKEREEISDWFDKRDKCLKNGETYHRANYPPELNQLGNEGSAGVKAIGVDLYNRKITFGQANKQIQDLGNNIIAKMIPIIKQYQAEIAAQKEAAEQRDRQRQESAAPLAAQQQAYSNAQYDPNRPVSTGCYREA